MGRLTAGCVGSALHRGHVHMAGLFRLRLRHNDRSTTCNYILHTASTIEPSECRAGATPASQASVGQQPTASGPGAHAASDLYPIPRPRHPRNRPSHLQWRSRRRLRSRTRRVCSKMPSPSCASRPCSCAAASRRPASSWTRSSAGTSASQPRCSDGCK